jgi:membrane peptidoglycan carboxypeptidase
LEKKRYGTVASSAVDSHRHNGAVRFAVLAGGRQWRFGCSPVARRMNENTEQPVREVCGSPVRMLNERTALELAAAMLDVVKRGTATGIKDALIGTGWTIGGKTGTGGIPGAPMSKQNGWFAGLIFNPRGEARFTVCSASSISSTRRRLFFPVALTHRICYR